MTTNKKSHKIEKYDGTNFGYWKMQIEDYLYLKDLYEPLMGEKPTSYEQSEWDLLDRKALATIRLSLSKSVAFNIKNEKTAVVTARISKQLQSKNPNQTSWFHCLPPMFPRTHPRYQNKANMGQQNGICWYE
ncbi:hypothetical protein IFM89_024998 [Coptis chinensis]|uniref:Uncharacterized protein n=1 Tax=Coptis chinensis TaxID=261450 RepID=A0A835HUN6_9MAGN|nr:hypothetical protein IFM89_024998 [Coptis chinensis]